MAGYGTYATIADLKGVLGITSTTDDVTMRKQLEAASRAIDNYCNRRFYVTSETKYLDGARTLWVPDLLSISAFKADEDGNGNYETLFEGTWVASTAYVANDWVKPTTVASHAYKCTTAGTSASSEPTWGTTNNGTTSDGTVTWTCYPANYLMYGTGLEDSLNTYPKVRIEINPDGDYSSFANGVKKGVYITGAWGYGDGISATPYVSDTTITEDLTAGEAAVDVTAVTNLSAGNTILIGTEQYYIYSIATLTLTTEPGVNGTTEATHTSGATISIYQYPADIRQACIDLGVALYQNRSKQGLQSERLGDYSYTMAGTSLGKSVIESILDNTIRGYKRLRF